MIHLLLFSQKFVFMKPYFKQTIAEQHIGITRYQNGVLLFDINKNQGNALLSLSEFLALPYSTYLLDLQGCTLKINNLGASICGFESSEQACGLSIFHVSSADSAKNLLDNCDSVTQQESVKIFDEFNMRNDGNALHFLSIKFPCYNDKQQLQGVLGLSIVVGQHPLAEAITTLTELGLLKNNQSDPNQILNFNLYYFNRQRSRMPSIHSQRLYR